MDEDPPDMNKFPRFQVWTDRVWEDFQEKVNITLRQNCCEDGDVTNAGSATVDFGSFDGENDWKYEVHVVPSGDDDRVKAAIEGMSRQKAWSNDFEADVIGWQEKLGDAMGDKEKLRPVRIIRGAEAETSSEGHFQ